MGFIKITNLYTGAPVLLNVSFIVEIYETGRGTLVLFDTGVIECKEDINTIADKIKAVQGGEI